MDTDNIPSGAPPAPDDPRVTRALFVGLLALGATAAAGTLLLFAWLVA
jgi:hypothetical protein